MNVEKEMFALDREHKALYSKYGRRFKAYYDKMINKIVYIDKAVTTLKDKRMNAVSEVESVNVALALTDTEV